MTENINEILPANQTEIAPLIVEKTIEVIDPINIVDKSPAS